MSSFGALVALAVAAAGGPTAPQKVAVWAIQPGADVSPGAAQVLEDVVATELARSGRFQVLARGDLRAALGYAREQQALGCSEEACLGPLGAAAGADLVLAGQAGRLGTQYRLSLVLVDARRAVAVARAARFTAATEDALAAVVPAVLADLLGAAPAAGAPAAPATAAALVDGAERRAREGRHAEAAAEYDRYPALFPEGKERCLALFRAGEAWDAAGKRALAAERFLQVGSDARCQASGPNAAAGALARAGGLYEALGRGEDAHEAFRRLVALPGVSDPSARAKVEAARLRLELAPAPR